MIMPEITEKTLLQTNNKALLNLLIGNDQERITEAFGDMNQLFDIFIDGEYACELDLRQKMLTSIQIMREFKVLFENTPTKTINRLKKKLSKTYENA
jgi:hypothetical protein